MSDIEENKMKEKIYICPSCGAQYKIPAENAGECDCQNAFRNIFGDITTEERKWIVSAFLETEKPITIQDPTNIYTYPSNRGRREGDIFYFWGRAYDFKNRTVSGRLPISPKILAFARMTESKDARSQFSPEEMRDYADECSYQL